MYENYMKHEMSSILKYKQNKWQHAVHLFLQQYCKKKQQKNKSFSKDKSQMTLNHISYLDEVMHSYVIWITKLYRVSTYAAADKVDLLAAVDPDIKPAAIGNQETCWISEDAEDEGNTRHHRRSHIPSQLRNSSAINKAFFSTVGLANLKEKQSKHKLVSTLNYTHLIQNKQMRQFLWPKKSFVGTDLFTACI